MKNELPRKIFQPARRKCERFPHRLFLHLKDRDLADRGAVSADRQRAAAAGRRQAADPQQRRTTAADLAVTRKISPAGPAATAERHRLCPARLP
ncbi:MAG: hypothetical protein GTO04_08975 [Planctomycetales bacterium]|nr:hypothetical protein [Planctomycetales bacterium]